MGNEEEQWIRQSERDLKTAADNIEDDNLYAAAFFCQQAAEKALKALYIKENQELWKIHDLVRLAEDLELPENMLEKCDALNPHYIATRYPVEVELSYEAEDAKHALEQAKEGFHG